MTIDPVGTSEANLVRNSIRYRLGDLFISICLKPWKIFSHARKFRDIVSVIAQRRLIRDFPRDFEIGQPNDPVLRSGLLNRLSINQLDKAQAKLKSALQGGTGPLTLDDPEFQPLIDRVEELRDLVRQGLRDDVGSMAARSGQVRSKHIAIAAHTGLPLRSNGYAIRTEALASKLTSLRPSWDINVWLRYSKINAELNTSIQANYKWLPSFQPTQLDLESYIEALANAYVAAWKNDPPALVHASSNYLIGAAAGRAAKRMNVPFIYEVRGLWEVTRASHFPAFKDSLGYRVQVKLETQVASSADKVIVISDALKSKLIQRGVDEDKISIIGNGAPDLKRALPMERQKTRRALGIADDSVLVGFVGSFTSYEGLPNLINAVLKARKTASVNINLLLVGDGSETTKLDTLAAGYNWVTMTGRVSPSEALSLHGALDIACYVRRDSSVTRLTPPLKPLEAMAKGVATIVADLPPFRELISDPEAAIFVTPDSVEDLAKSIRTLSDDPLRRNNVAAVGLTYIATQTWESKAEKLSVIYDSLLN